MDRLVEQWKKEERFPFKGWDFSHLKGRMIEEKTPWNYILMAKKLVKKSNSVLDIGTGENFHLKMKNLMLY